MLDKNGSKILTNFLCVKSQMIQSVHHIGRNQRSQENLQLTPNSNLVVISRLIDMDRSKLLLISTCVCFIIIIKHLEAPAGVCFCLLQPLMVPTPAAGMSRLGQCLVWAMAMVGYLVSIHSVSVISIINVTGVILEC